MIILIIGFICSGKTSIGLELCHNLRMKFCEMDKLVYNHTGLKKDSKIKNSLWKECQLEISKDLSTQDNLVISCSGDIIENNLNLIYFGENAFEVKTIFLTASQQALTERLQQKKPDVENQKIQQKIQEFYEKRLLLYKSFADTSIDTTNLSVNEAASIIQKFIKK